MNNPIVSVHIPKTGGVTFRELLMEVTQNNVFFDYGDRPTAPSNLFRKIRNFPRDKIRSAKVRKSLSNGARAVIHGHFLASKYDRHFPNASHATWLRDPVERFVSQYYYWQREPDSPHEIYQRFRSENMDMVTFANVEEMRNVNLRFLDGKDLEEFDFVGITEEYGRGLALFLKIFFPQLSSINTSAKNANPERKGKAYDLDPKTREVIMQLNAADLALYERARQRFNALCEAHGL